MADVDKPHVVRVVLRPVATPLPLGFLGLFVAASATAALQLGWVPTSGAHSIALAVLVLSVPAQAVAGLAGFLARDAVAATGMSLQSVTWAAYAATTLSLPPGSSSHALGVVLVAAGTALLVPAFAGRAKLAAGAVLALTGVRFAMTGVAELTAGALWTEAAGWTGVGLAALAFYAALAFELEGVRHRTVLPVGRHGSAQAALEGDPSTGGPAVLREPGVREQL